MTTDSRCAYFRWKGEHDWRRLPLMPGMVVRVDAKRVCRVCKLERMGPD